MRYSDKGTPLWKQNYVNTNRITYTNINPILLVEVKTVIGESTYQVARILLYEILLTQYMPI